ncbi:MAG TPA: DegT/DnrJ/EryC1/StrS family aminotransferase [Fibrobacteria bacterium]|nr:DegT/DnrJ/EryC1/StrS family aminotransferase [Fibrobacteria bacterium]
MEFCDLSAQYAAYKTEIDQAMASVIASTAFINGPEVKTLEQELIAFSGAPHAIACANGTDALQVPLMAMGVGPGDEIIVPDFTFFATAEVVSVVGATPVFADIDPVTFNITVDTIRPLITKKTKGIIPVSLYGQMPDLEAISALAREHGLWVMEDGAQSFGATRNGSRSTSVTGLATTSFFPAKPLGCYGDGGAIFCQDEALAARIRVLCNHGQVKRYHHGIVGLNSRLDSLQAAILRVKLRHFQDELTARDRIATMYTDRLRGVVSTPVVDASCFSAWAQYTIRVPHREKVQAHLQSKGIPTAVHYPVPLHRQEVFAHLGITDDRCPNATLASKEVMSLPMHAFLTEAQIDEVTTAMKEAL